MSHKIKYIDSTDQQSWDDYVLNHPESNLYHLSDWKNVIEKTYGHKSYNLMAIKSSKLKGESSKDEPDSTQNPKLKTQNSETVVGILPLVHMKHFIFGNSLISIPFFDMGGVLADNEEVEKALIEEAIKLGQKLKVDNIELRHQKPLNWLNTGYESLCSMPYAPCTEPHALCSMRSSTLSHKVRMLLELPESSEELMKSFKSKLRSQINKPIKEGLVAKIGGTELLDDFYKVFLINMRDLGSPVHSKKILKNVLNQFSKDTKIIMIYKDNEPVAGSIVIGFKQVLENPWASSLRQYSRLSPNMFLYWTMLEYACDNGFKYFDFGRSTPEEGTYKFKQQWGSQPHPLHWQYISLGGKPVIEKSSEKSKFDKAIQYWQKLPVPVTGILGPMIRKHIGL